MAQNKYSNISKKQIINVINQQIIRIDAIEVTLNLFIKFIGREEEFSEFMNKELGGLDEARTDESDNNGGDNPENQSNA
jgi:hypothetical protein